MAPSMAININPQGMADSVGAAVPLAFVLATVGILLVAYTFRRLAQRYDHAGSVYGYVGATLGVKAGVIAGWMLIGCYIMGGVLTAVAAGRFATDLAQSIGAYTDPTEAVIYAIAVVVVLGTLIIALGSAKSSTAILVALEAGTVALILVVSAVIFFHLLRGSAPAGQTIDMSVFTKPTDLPVSALFLGVTFGFLSFAGFEAATTLGEEARDPRRAIPWALGLVPLIGGAFFIVVSAVEVWGFGTNSTGLAAFENSQSLMGELATAYVSPWVGDLITIGALCSAISGTTACIVAASRLIYAYNRDDIIPGRFDEVSEETGSPARAIITVATIVIALILGSAFVLRASSLEVFIQAGDTFALLILMVYGLATIGMVRMVFFARPPASPLWQVILPVGALGLLGYALFSSVWPVPEGVNLWAPCLAFGWTVIGCLVALRVKNVPRSIEEALGESVSV